jgi:uncharacterized protein YeaO (DUF488 family)
MATPYVSRSEYNDDQNSLYARITRYMDARFEALNGQILSDRNETRKHFDEQTRRFDEQTRRFDEQAKHQEEQTKRLDDVETFQKMLLDVYQTTTATIVKSIAESHAAIMDEINGIKRRLPPIQE